MSQPTPEIMEQAREGGRRKLFRIRFPSQLGWESEFYFRTLSRGEIVEAFRQVGHLGLIIPSTDLRAQVRFQDLIFRSALVFAPDGFGEGASLAGIITQCAEVILEFSGFKEGSKTQNKIIEQAKAFAMSPEGRMEALVVNSLHLHPSEVRSMMYDEFTTAVYQSIILQGELLGNPVGDYLDPEGAKDRLKTVAHESRLDKMLTIPSDFKIRGLRYDDKVMASQDEGQVFKATNNLTPQQQRELLEMLYGKRN